MSLTPVMDCIRTQRNLLAAQTSEFYNHLYLHPELAEQICLEIEATNPGVSAMQLCTLHGMHVHEVPYLRPHAILLTINLIL